MKYMFASDIHGSAYYCRKMLKAYEDEGASRLILLGDILYHGPRNDLPKEYAPKEVIQLLNEKRITSIMYGATAMRKWIRWYWTSPYWQTMRCWSWTERLSMPAMAIYIMKEIFRH